MNREALYEKTLSCVHCGLCLPACPAYGTWVRESVAPRGQVYNIRAMLEGRLSPTPTLSEEIYDCLTCRACESVCPSGVTVGAIVEGARALLAGSGAERPLVGWIKRLALGGVVSHPKRLRHVMDLLRLYEVSGARRLARRALRLLWPALAGREALMPSVPPRSERRPLPAWTPAEGPRRKKVAFFAGCIAAHWFGDVNRATVSVLARNGFEVVVPEGQTCCGALHIHNGLPGEARDLARENVAAFRDSGVEAIVVNAAGCGAALAEYGELLAGEEGAVEFARRIVDVSAFLVREGFAAPKASLTVRVAYDAPCHLHHAQRVQEEPRRLLASIPGLTLVPFRDPDRCCGSAGIYNLTRYPESMKMLDEKMGNIREARPDIIATGNPGCLIQLALGVRRIGLEAEVVHPIGLLERAYRLGNQ